MVSISKPILESFFKPLADFGKSIMPKSPAELPELFF